jgi:hypothetical protein
VAETRVRKFWLARVPVLMLIALGACLASAGTASAEDMPPAIGGGSASPNHLSYDGGAVQISAEISDDGEYLQNVTAEVVGTNGYTQTVSLFQSGGNTFYGTVEAPANYEESSVSYSVEVSAYDDANNYSRSTVAGFEVEGRPQFDEPPYIGETQLFPNFLPAEGGDVTIRIEAGDNRGLSEVFATASNASGTTVVPLQATNFGRFEGTFHAPSNVGSLAAEYMIEAIAADDIGQQARVDLGTVTVEPAALPLSPGTLRPKQTSHRFRPVRIAKGQAHWTFAVRNTPRNRRGGTVSGTIRLSGSSAFSFDGVPSGEIHFTLAPGEVLKQRVSFAPTTVGPHSGTIEMARDDGGQPGLATTIGGEGLPPRQPHRRPAR